MNGPDESAAPANDSDAMRRSGVRILGFAFVGLFVLLCIGALVAYLGLSGKPDHWNAQQQRIAGMNPQEREAISEAMLHHVLDKWSEGPKHATSIEDLIGQRTTLTIPYEDLNIWLAEEGISLLEEVGIRMPRSVKGTMVDSAGNGLLRISCDVKSRRIQQVVALTFDIKVANDGTIQSRLVSASAGLLPLPRESAVDLIAKRADNKDGLMYDLMQGNPVPPIELPIDPTEDGLRDGRLVGLEVREDAMVVTRETVRRKQANNK